MIADRVEAQVCDCCSGVGQLNLSMCAGFLIPGLFIGNVVPLLLKIMETIRNAT